MRWVKESLGALRPRGVEKDSVLLAGYKLQQVHLNDSFVPCGDLALDCKLFSFSYKEPFFIGASKEILECVKVLYDPRAEAAGSRLSVALEAGPGASLLWALWLELLEARPNSWRVFIHCI